MKPTADHRRFDRCSRLGVYAVEMAIVLPVFMILVVAVVEFGHTYLAINMLNAAAKRTARYAATEGVSTAQAEQHIRKILTSAFDDQQMRIAVKDGSVFDSGNVDPENVDYDALPPIELSEAETSQLFLIRVEVDYDDVAIMPPFWMDGLTITGQSVMRHE